MEVLGALRSAPFVFHLLTHMGAYVMDEGVPSEAIAGAVIIVLLLVIAYLLTTRTASVQLPQADSVPLKDTEYVVPTLATEPARRGGELWEEQFELLTNLDCGEGHKHNPFYIKHYLERIEQHVANEEWEKAEDVCSEGLNRDPGNTELVKQIRFARSHLREKRTEERDARKKELLEQKAVCAIHGAVRQLYHMKQQPDGTWHCFGRNQCEGKQVVCAIHGKTRSRQLMFRRPDLSWVCEPESSCLLAGGGSTEGRKKGRTKKKRRTICFAFYSNGTCPNENCEFDHSQVRPELRVAQLQREGYVPSNIRSNVLAEEWRNQALGDVSADGMAAEWREQPIVDEAERWRHQPICQPINDTEPWVEEWDEED